MLREFLFGILSVYCFQPVLTISMPSESSYVGGVVEYFKIRYTDQFRETEENLNNYLDFIYSPEAKDIDILVFPESSLNNLVTAAFVPEPEDNVDPCTDYTNDWAPIIKKISCAAKATRKYIVINISEKSWCPDRQQIKFNDTRPCAEIGFNRYNANVVFNRNGVVVSKYRKYNLFETIVLSPFLPESIPFTTDFGVTFGHFICFDLMFDRPALDLIKDGVTDIIFTTMWFSELPFLNAVQPQMGWAYKHNVNFLASGASFPVIGSTGTGIFHGRAGALTAVMTDVPVSKLYKAEIPKIGSGLAPKISREPEIDPVDMLKLYLKRDQLDPYNTTLVESNRAYSTELCSGNVCCQFSIDVEFQAHLLSTQPNEDYYKYRVAAFDGIRTFDGFADGGVKVCAVFACTDDTPASCGTRFTDDVKIVRTHTFKTIKIATKFDPQENLLVIPSTLTTSIMPLEANYFEYKEEKQTEKEVAAEISLTQDVSNLYTFAIYARDFSRDKKTPISKEALAKLYAEYEKRAGNVKLS